jgi:uncharacterized delta-60 repeat protein
VAALAATLLSTNLFGRAAGDDGSFTPMLAGDLDATFGNEGRVTTDFFGRNDVANAVTLQPDGKIIAAGFASMNGSSGFSLARYNADGSLDSSFGTDGKVFTAGISSLAAVTLQADGKIVAAGGGLGFIAARYLQDGSLDPAFGNGGRVITVFTGSSAGARALTIQEDGRIVLAGGATASGAAVARDFALVRYNTDGSLDQSFGAGGKVLTDFTGGDDEATGIVVRSSGELVVAGTANIGTGSANSNFGLARYRTDGSLDPSFGLGGKVVTDFFGKADAAFGLATQSNGRLIVAGLGQTANVGSAFALACYNADGSLDATFGSGGRVSSFQSSQASAVVIQPDGRVIAVGAGVTGGAGVDIWTARYNSNGTLDSGFGNGGIVKTDFSGGVEGSSAVALQPDGQIVVAGYTAPEGDFARADFALIRHQKDDRPDFALSVNPASITLSPGTKRKVSVDVTRVGGFTGDVTITAPDTSALNVKVIPLPSAAEQSLKFKIKIKPSALPGTYQLDFTGSDDAGRTRAASLSLVVE